MTLFLIVLALIAVAAVVRTGIEIARDGYGRRPTIDPLSVVRHDES